MKILIVEDEAVIAESLYQLLLQLDYDPLEPVDTPEDAIESINRDDPQMVILDLTLQDRRSGLEVAAYLTTNKPNIPFIILTAHSDPTTISEVKKHKPAAYLVKPFMRESLFAAIEMATPVPDTVQMEASGETQSLQGTELFIKIGTRHEKVDLRRIISLQAAGKYTELHFEDQPKRLIRTPLSQFIEAFPAVKWLRIHKSHAVNPEAIVWVGAEELEAGGRRIPIGRFFQPAVERFVDGKTF